MTNEFIEELFYKQIKELTKRTADSFDVQHSDSWFWGEKMIVEEKTDVYYPETIAMIVLEHNLIEPEEHQEFLRYVRGF